MISTKREETVAVKKAAAKKAVPVKSAAARKTKPVKAIKMMVAIRMYCIGTGDCFIYKFRKPDGSIFTMMIDCGSCRGDENWFKEYVDDLSAYVNKKIDLLVITHEHNDHVNGFAKWPDVFKGIAIKEAWFAWTENPADPGGTAADLMKKRTEMKAALSNAITEIISRNDDRISVLQNQPFADELIASQDAFLNGLQSLAEINLRNPNDAESNGQLVLEKTKLGISGGALPGMKSIKDILANQNTTIRYLSPGETVTVKGLEGIRFYVLGPPQNKDFIFKEGKEGSDVFKKNTALNESTLAARAFNNIGNNLIQPEDLPFEHEYIIGRAPDTREKKIIQNYQSVDPTVEGSENWRKIDDEWLMSAGVLALRLNSHINNTSLALAVESVESSKVLLLPGDAEYGSWESWHLIDIWKEKGKDKKHLVEDLLNRTVFYKVGHHLSYNGTALEKGIKMMPGENMAAMATLDRERISSGWKSTMPNKFLMQELMHKTGGLFFIMNEADIDNPPSRTLDSTTLSKDVYEEKRRADGAALLYKQYTLEI